MKTALFKRNESVKIFQLQYLQWPPVLRNIYDLYHLHLKMKHFSLLIIKNLPYF